MSLLLTFAIFAFIMLMTALYTLLAYALPSRTRQEANPPAPLPLLAPLLDAAEAELAALGFQHFFDAEIRFTPARVLQPNICCYSLSADRLTLAFITIDESANSADRAQVYLYSRSAAGAFLGTAPWNLLIAAYYQNAQLQMADYPDLAAQYQAHLAHIAAHAPEPWPDAAQTLALMNDNDAQMMDKLYQRRWLQRLRDGSARLTLRGACRALPWAFRRPTQRDTRGEQIPRSRHVLYWWLWQKQQARNAPAPAVGWTLLAVSALLFYAIGAWLWSPQSALLLLFVVGLHESGHWLAMRFFGYRQVRVLFLPLFGGVTIGEAQQSSARERAWVALAGPLPGLILASLLSLSGLAQSHPWLSLLTVQLLLLNLFNLLPILPLDGGQILQNLLPRQNTALTLAFNLLSLALIILLARVLHSQLILILAWLPVQNLLALGRERRLHNRWQALPAPANEAAAMLQALELIQREKHSTPKAEGQIRLAENFLRSTRHTAMPVGSALLIATIWAASFLTLLLPQMQVLLRLVGG